MTTPPDPDRDPAGRPDSREAGADRGAPQPGAQPQPERSSDGPGEQTAATPPSGQQPEYGQPGYGQPGYGQAYPGPAAQPGYGDPAAQAPYGQQPGYGPPPGYGPGYGPPPGYGEQPFHGRPPQAGYDQQAGYGQYPAGSPYVYNPYAQYPAGTDGRSEPVGRPGIVNGALALLVLSALPFLLLGLVAAVVTLDASVLPPDLADELAAAGVEVADLLAGVRVLGIVMALLAAVYIGLAVLAHRGVNGARITIAVLTSIFVLFLLLGVLGGGAGDPVSLLFGLSVVAASVGGTVLLFAPAASAWFTARR